ncbi:MAG: hypothetical protein IKA75_08905 [Bacteroidaceae bacterium]|nr:hypothetical protein [Bacteroidaceae bacterium]
MKRGVLKSLWLLPVLTVGLVFLSPYFPSVLDRAVWYLFLVMLVAIPVSWVILCMNKMLGRCVVSFLLSAVGIYVLLLWGIKASFEPDRSTFGKDHPIPEDMECHVPYASDARPEVVVDSLDADSYLQVWDDYQGGMYKYDFHYGPLPAGQIFLRCFEATENIPLSDVEVLGKSRVKFAEPVTSFAQLADKQGFTIYEGVWGDYYAARIEVWFKDAATGKERKLLEKVYRVEGWQR